MCYNFLMPVCLTALPFIVGKVTWSDAFTQCVASGTWHIMFIDDTILSTSTSQFYADSGLVCQLRSPSTNCEPACLTLSPGWKPEPTEDATDLVQHGGHDIELCHYCQPCVTTNHGRSCLCSLSCLLLSAASTAITHIQCCHSLIHAFTSCHLDYCTALLYGIVDSRRQRLQSVQNFTARLEYWAHHADPEVSALVADLTTGGLEAGNSGAQLPCWAVSVTTHFAQWTILARLEDMSVLFHPVFCYIRKYHIQVVQGHVLLVYHWTNDPLATAGFLVPDIYCNTETVTLVRSQSSSLTVVLIGSVSL